jgi:hypothetical protein
VICADCLGSHTKRAFLGEDGIPNFVRFNFVNWIDEFSRTGYKNIFLENLECFIEHTGLVVHACVIMSNHV